MVTPVLKSGLLPANPQEAWRSAQALVLLDLSVSVWMCGITVIVDSGMYIFSGRGIR